MKTMNTGSMVYYEAMETTNSNIMDKVLTDLNQYDPTSYSSSDVERVLEKTTLTPYDFATLLSPAALSYLEPLAQKAVRSTKQYFGNAISLFTPLYISNYCENQCVYCGFNSHNNIRRGCLTLEEIEEEMSNIAKTGLQELLILTGESRKHSSVTYIGDVVQMATHYFSTIGIEIYPLNTDEYAFLRSCGVDFVSVYQETYSLEKYEKVHLNGPKRSFPYRFNTQERAIKAGLRGVAFGALLGLDDYRRDAYATGLHAYYLQQNYPHAEISFSTPRIRPFINGESADPLVVHEKELLQVILAYRLFMPYAGITISTRERPKFRDHIVGMAATKMSAGVHVGVGGHLESDKGDAQFEIADTRSVNDIHQMLLSRGLQPIYTDYIRV